LGLSFGCCCRFFRSRPSRKARASSASRRTCARHRLQRADFDQKVYDRSGKLVQESKGNFAFLRPGRFRWTYAKPNPQLIVGDGERVWVYDEDLKQVTVRKLEKALGSTPAALLAGAADIEKAFTLSDGGDKEGLAWVEAKPREKEAGFERVRLGLGTSGVEAMELVDNFGQTTRLKFSSIQRNPKLDGSEFRFTPPKGADVLGEK
jgi:outer membrane lipoprotein carrier protein